MGGAGDATNPGQLCAAGWGSCSLGSVRLVAAERKAKLTSTAITTAITLAQSDHGGFGLAAILNLELGGIDQETTTELGNAARHTCPYSKAMRGNIPVTLNTTAV
ncbi:Ohr family peroxiredoxin [Streptomyces sp. NPDC001156]